MTVSTVGKVELLPVIYQRTYTKKSLTAKYLLQERIWIILQQREWWKFIFQVFQNCIVRQV